MAESMGLEDEGVILAMAKALVRESSQPFPDTWNTLRQDVKDYWLRMGRAAYRAKAHREAGF